MPEFHTLVMQVSKTTNLFVASWEIKYATYIALWRIRDVYPGSRIRLFPSRIPDPNCLHPGYRIPDPHQRI
jgi:hypothetical protein